MRDTSENWIGAADRKTVATLHNTKMEQQYAEAIKYSSERVQDVRTEAFLIPCDKLNGSAPQQLILDMDCVSAVKAAKQAQPTARVALVDFASFREIGGGFLKGAMAQEEAICHASTLYNVLIRHKEWYKRHDKAACMNGLYRNEALYCPDIIFPDAAGDIAADVIVCAAPNLHYYQKYANLKPGQTTDQAMYSRLQFISRLAQANAVDILITGAFGCGVFANDPVKVAKMSVSIFGGSNIPVVAYAIPGQNTPNYQRFWEVKTEYNKMLDLP